MNIVRQTACFMVNPITVNNFADLFNWTPVIRASDLMMAPANDGSGAWWSVFGRAHRGSTVGLLLLQLYRVGLLLSTRLVSYQWWILIYMFAGLIHWYVEVLHADRTTSMCIWTTVEPRARLLQRKTGLSPPVIYYWPFQCDTSVVVYPNCQCSSALWLSLTYCSIYLG